MKNIIGLIIISLFIISCGGESDRRDLEIKKDTTKGTIGTVDTLIAPDPELIEGEQDTVTRRRRVIAR
jgi:hypothetical protein